MREPRHTARVQGAPAPLVVDDPRRVGELAAELVVNRLVARPAARLLLPTGRSPHGMYAALRAHAAAGSLLSDRATVLQLDEYAGLGPADQRSFAAQLREQLRGVPLAALGRSTARRPTWLPRPLATTPCSRRRRSTWRFSGSAATATSRSTSRRRRWRPGCGWWISWPRPERTRRRLSADSSGSRPAR